MLSCLPIESLLKQLTNGEKSMDVLAERLDAKLREWELNTVAEVRERIAEIIDFADHDVLDITQSRSVEQEVLNLLESTSQNQSVQNL